MEYNFGDYRFNSDQLVLTKNGNNVSIRSNEAKLLALLLSDPEKVFNKQEILDVVWAGKSVAEQSIFQNISHLRSTFGNDAIKNHPKKGYQWQLPLEQQHSLAEPQKINNPTAQRNIFKPVSLVLLIALTLSTLLFLFKSPTSISAPQVKLGVFNLEQSNSYKLFANSHELQQLNNKATNTLVYQPLLQSFSLEDWYSHQKSSTRDLLVSEGLDLLLFLRPGTLGSHFQLKFQLVSETNQWNGTLMAESQQAVTEKLLQHLASIVGSGLMELSSGNLKQLNATLQLLYAQYPGDGVILHQLIRNLNQLGHNDEALLLLKQLEDLTESLTYTAYLGEVYLQRSIVTYDYAPATEVDNNIKLAKEQFTQLNNYSGLLTATDVKASMAYIASDYETIKEELLPVVNLLNKAKEHSLELNSFISLIVYANKFKAFTDRDFYLAQAQRIISTNSLSPEYYASIYFQQALFAEQSGEFKVAKTMYRKVLTLFKPDQDDWHKERAQYHLSKILTKQENFQQAVNLFKEETTPTIEENLILAQIYQDWNKIKQSTDFASNAYDAAILAGELNLSLSAALKLLELEKSGADLSIYNYAQHIKNNSNPRWINQAEQRLKLVGLYHQVNSN